jgi:hypothetical protein
VPLPLYEKGVGPKTNRPRSRVRGRVAWFVLGIGVASAFVGALVTFTSTGPPQVRPGPEGMPLERGRLLPPPATHDGAPIGSVGCSPSEEVVYHIHIHVRIFVRGESRPLPPAIGIVGPVPRRTPWGMMQYASHCYYWLHSHTSDGLIHVEAPAVARYTFGDFLDVWGNPPPELRSGSTTSGPANGVVAFVNGVPYQGNIRDIALEPKESIQIDIGQPVTPFRATDWSFDPFG